MDITRLYWFVWNTINRLRYESLFSNFCFITRKTLSPFRRIDVYFILRKDLIGGLEESRAQVEVDVKLASTAERDQAARLDGGGLAWSRAWSRLGHKCFVAKIGPTVVARGWLGFREMQQSSFSVALDDDEAYITDAYTVRAWRGKGIHSELEYSRILYAREAGYRTIYVLISVDNERSGRSFHRRSWEESGVVLCTRRCRGGKSQVWCIRGSPHPVRSLDPSPGTERDSGMQF